MRQGSLKQNRTTADGDRDCPTVLHVGHVVSWDLLFNINSRYPLFKFFSLVSTSSEKMTDAEKTKPVEDFLFKGKRLDCKKKIFSKGFFLFDGYWKENENAGAEKERVKSKTSNLKKEVAIRRIKNEDCLDGWKDVADKLVKGNLNHNNILRVFGYEEDVANGWRYFALEPYSATLYEYCNGKYKGAMPNESQVLYQITNGVNYLHGKGIVHGDLNPLNVVIAAQVPSCAHENFRFWMEQIQL
ncbi:spindle assembly checkpoint kinase-like isoform X2 [Daphnia magna]|nr:spindle assembly checkpoint kinase-like isoform X2 [Daphnia magna]XP_045023865.1 spindle assembly checkpoint kinase-like isoform X2 [Daphnia magna]XP_045023866.1 spindle assembly checkpoint kinase-like isoform X2 [Daphnia magna]